MQSFAPNIGVTAVTTLFEMLKCGDINTLHFNIDEFYNRVFCHIRRYRGNFIVREVHGFGATQEEAAQIAMASYMAMEDRDVSHLGNSREAQTLALIRNGKGKRSNHDI